MRQLSFLVLLLGLAAPGFAGSNLSFRQNKSLALTIECPPNITLSTDQINCSVPFTYSITASDDQPGWSLTQTTGLASGAIFPLGETLNQFQVTGIGGNTASCSFTVTVVDSIKPVCTPPANVTISAKNFDPTLLDYGQPVASDNCCLDTTTTEVNYNLFDTVCNKGTIVRNFRAFDCHGNSTLSTQRIVVTYDQDYYVKFPDDVILVTCDGTGNYGVPQFSGNGSASLQVSYEDMFYLLTDVCATLTRVWTIKNTCTFDPALPFTYLPNPTPSPIGLDSANMPGPIVSDCAALAPWAPTEVKLHPGDSVTTNFCTFYTPGSNGYKYNQIVRFIDHQDPVFSDCPAGPVTAIDSTQNKPEIWHDQFNPAVPVQDLDEAAIDLNISGTDSCSFASVYITYLLFLDLDNDGTAETVVNPNNPPATAGVVYYGNAAFPNYNGGTPVTFDKRVVPANQKWRFAAQTTVTGNGRTVAVRWNTQQDPNTYVLPQLPRGSHYIKWIIEDACGNTSVCQYNFSILADSTLPVVICPSNVTVSTNLLSCDAAVDYTVSASDDQSGWMLTQTAGFESGAAFPLGLTINQFQVSDMGGNTATCSFAVTVADQIKPVCTPPADVAVSCEDFDPTLLAYGQPSVTDNCCVDTVIAANNYALFDSLCNRGTISRSFKAYDCSGNSSVCTQKVVVNYNQAYFIKFPDDRIVTTCDGTGAYGEPVFFGKDCELLSYTYQDEIIDVVPDVCFKIERVWTITNWCTYNPALTLVDVPNPNPNPIVNHPANLPGPTVSACGTPAPWASTVVKLNPTDVLPTNFCTFYVADANGYRYKQHIKIIDTQNPVNSNCPAATQTLSDSTLNDPDLWRNVFNPALPVQDLGEAAIDLQLSAADACSGVNVNFKYLLFLDLDDDGNQETVVNSTNLPSLDSVYVGNAAFPNYIGGTAAAFDQRAVPSTEKWQFALQATTNGGEKTAAVRWNTLQTPGTFVLPQLPKGTHKIKWITEDGCGNSSSCEYNFTIETDGTVASDEPGNERQEFVLYQNRPNPSNGNTTIDFNLPESMPATLSIYNAAGGIVYQQAGEYHSGRNSILINKELSALTGVLYYKLKTAKNSAWRKMVVIR